MPVEADGTARLSMRDRMDVLALRELARGLGYDRMVIHERQPGDPPELESVLGIYRRGEAWCAWWLARRGAEIRAWSGVHGTEAGPWPTLAAALAALTGGAVAHGEVVQAFG